MSKESIFLTESQLRCIVKESITKILSEMDLTSVAFSDAMFNYANNKIDNSQDVGHDMNGKCISEFERNEKARKLRNQTLAHYLLQEIGPMQFTFRIYDDKVGGPVAATFAVSSVVGYNDSSITFGGKLRQAGNDGIKIVPASIEYVFESGEFYHNTYINRNKRRVKLLFPSRGEMADSNNKTIEAILACLKAYREESEKLYNELVKNGSTNRFHEYLMKRLSNMGNDTVPTR